MHNNTHKLAQLRPWLLLPLFLLVCGCSVVPDSMKRVRLQPDVHEQATPKTLPRKTLTSFTQALLCMDEMLASDASAKKIIVSLSPIPESFDSITGMTDMLMTSLSTMSSNNRMVRIVTNVPDDNPFYSLTENPNFTAPDLFIRMSAPQVETQVQTNDNSGQVRLPLFAFDTSLDAQKNASIISIDMNMGEIDTLQLLPGVYSRNSIVVVNGSRKGAVATGNLSGGGAQFPGEGGFDSDYDSSVNEDEGGDYYMGDSEHYEDSAGGFGKITKFGTNFRVNFSYKEGKHTAVRTLIELGVIELLGKYYKLPYRDCLVEATSETESIISADLETSTENEAINGISPASSTVFTNETLPEKTDNSVLNLILKAKDSTRPAIYRRGDSIELSLTASSDAYAFCYYQQYSGDIYQIFPSPYEKTSKISAGTTLNLPSDSKLSLIADSLGPDESVQCVAHPVGSASNPPPKLFETSFFSISSDSLNDIINQHRAINEHVAVSKRFVLSLHF